MEETFFTVEEAAGVLRCSGRTVYRLMDEGWLSRPNGGTRTLRMGKVTKKSVFQYLIVDHVSRYPKKVLKEIRRGRKKFAEIFCQNAEAKRFSSNEGPGETDPSPYPLPQGEGKQQHCPPRPPSEGKQQQGIDEHAEGKQQGAEPTRCLHHDFVERHQFSFGWRARQLAKDDPAMQDDLVQEMSLAVLEYAKPARFEFLFELAVNRAIDYLRYEELRGTMSLDEARHVTDATTEKISSLNAFIDALTRGGVPAEWIDEVLEWWLRAA